MSVASPLAARWLPFETPYLIWLLGAVLILAALPAWSVLVELSLFPLLYLIVGAVLPIPGQILSFPFVVALLVILAHPLRSRLAPGLVVLGALASLDPWALWATPPSGWLAWTLLGAGAFALLTVLLAVGRHAAPPRHIDLLLCSYTGNTAHYARAFAAAAEQVGAQVTEHRFHHYRDFRSDFCGDALVVAFPVAGWNPMWPVLEYLLFRLPRGNGKAAFILYTSAGGPENTHLVPWLALWLRGYRVMGRLGAMYPLNIPIVRLPSTRFMRWFDTFLPRTSDVRLVERAAQAFCRGERTGLGLALFPCVLFILGPLTYNRYINYIFRSYSWKRLCNDCQRCIRYCPSERLYMKNGRVRSKGTCVLCMGCANICPTDAMQVLFLTELGNPYHPRWPKLLVKRKPGGQAAADDDATN
jgi:ferredoxin